MVAGVEKRGWAKELGFVALLLVVACAFCAPWFVGNSLPLRLEGLGSLAPWKDAGESVPALASHEDVLQTYPWFRFLHESALKGDSLLWYPLESLGHPFFALWDTRVLSPFSLPFYGASLADAFRYSVLLKLLLALWVAYYALRRLGFSRVLALFGSVSYGVSGIFLTAPMSPIADTMVWFPLWIVVLERFALGNHNAWPLGGLVLGILGFSGAPEGVLFAVCFAPLYLVLRIRLEGSSKESFSFSTLGIALLAGLGLLALQGLPYLEAIRHLESSATQGVLTSGDWSALFLPGLAGGQGAMLMSIGGIAILILPLWLSLFIHVEKPIRARTEAAFLSALLLVMVGSFASLLPAFSALSGATGMLFLAFPLVLMAVNAAEDWVHLDADQVKQVLKSLMVYAPVFWGGYIVLALVLAGGVGSYLAVGVYIVVIASVAFLLLRTLIKPSETTLGGGLTVLSLVWAIILIYPLRPVALEEAIYPETAMVQSLAGLKGRIGGRGGIAQWPLAGNGIESIRGSDGMMTARYQDFLAVCEEDPLLLRRAGASGLVLTKEDIQGPYARVRPVLQIEDVYASGAVLFRDLAVQSRARMIYAGQKTTWPGDGALMAGPKGQSLVEDAVIAPENPGPVASAIILGGGGNGEVRVQVEETRPGILVMADAWYPGWRATVNGHAAKVKPVDYAFRGVEVGQGKQDIVFNFQPNSVFFGKVISALSALAIMLALRKLLPRRRKS